MNDQQWTGRPMAESCDTTDFFERDKVYRNTSKPLIAEELWTEFSCKAVFVHPSTSVLYAVGVIRHGRNRPWNPYPVNLMITNWKEGWKEIQLSEEEGA